MDHAQLRSAARLEPCRRKAIPDHNGHPETVEWYREGRQATREEVLRSIEEGLPNLEALARQEDGGMAHLAECRRRFELWLPPETRQDDLGLSGAANPPASVPGAP